MGYALDKTNSEIFFKKIGVTKKTFFDMVYHSVMPVFIDYQLTFICLVTYRHTSK